MDNMEIEAVNLKGNQPWIFIGRTDAEAEVPILWPPDTKSQLTVKDTDAGKDCRQEENGKKRMKWLNSITNSMDKFEQTWGYSEGQESLVCYSQCGHKESDTTIEQK